MYSWHTCADPPGERTSDLLAWFPSCWRWIRLMGSQLCQIALLPTLHSHYGALLLLIKSFLIHKSHCEIIILKFILILSSKRKINVICVMSSYPNSQRKRLEFYPWKTYRIEKNKSLFLGTAPGPSQQGTVTSWLCHTPSCTHAGSSPWLQQWRPRHPASPLVSGWQRCSALANTWKLRNSLKKMRGWFLYFLLCKNVVMWK